VPDLVSTILAKALVMLIQALIARLFLQFMRGGSDRGLVAVAA
jgi:hypothetical protein